MQFPPNTCCSLRTKNPLIQIKILLIAGFTTGPILSAALQLRTAFEYIRGEYLPDFEIAYLNETSPMRAQTILR